MDEATRSLLSVREGSEEAFARFVHLTQADVWRFCAYLASPADADDCTQETYLRALRSADRFRGDAPARSWLLTIARRTVADHLRGHQRRRRLTTALRPDPPADDPAVEVTLGRLLVELAPDRRAAFVLTQVLGYTYEEAAGVCGCAVGTIRSRVARARDQLVEAERGGDEAAGSGP